MTDFEGNAFDRLIYYALQPLLVIGAIVYWYDDPSEEARFLIALLAVQLVLGAIEYIRPARYDWRQPGAEKALYVFIVLVLLVLSGSIGDFYRDNIAAPFAAFREALNLDVWPHEWPLLVQVAMVFFASEFIWYWMHRAEHRWRIVWRTTGHGAHHAFKRLGAINFGLNHPLELLVLALPTLLVDLTFGVGVAAAGSVMITSIQASIAHTNIRLNSDGIGWLLTTNEYHLRHHSMILEESNTNYGCAAIVWDRLFRTFSAGATAETGIGPSEPTLWQKALMPIKEPTDSQVAP